MSKKEKKGVRSHKSKTPNPFSALTPSAAAADKNDAGTTGKSAKPLRLFGR
jgi:hypothetical protein